MTKSSTMLEIDTPGFGNLRLEHLVLDFNGTLAVDGNLLPQTGPPLRELSKHMRIHVLTADTFGRANEELPGLPVELDIIGADHQDDANADIMVGDIAQALQLLLNPMRLTATLRS